MNDASTASVVPAAASASGLSRLIAPGLLSASVLYLVATTASFRGPADASAVVDAFLAAALPCLVVIMLLWASRPAVFPQRRRRRLVAVMLLSSAAASILPVLFGAG